MRKYLRLLLIPFSCLVVQACKINCVNIKLTSEYQNQPATGVDVRLMKGWRQLGLGHTNAAGKISFTNVRRRKIAVLISTQNKYYLPTDTAFLKFGKNNTLEIERTLYPSALKEKEIWDIEDSIYGPDAEPLYDLTLAEMEGVHNQQDAEFSGGMRKIYSFVHNNVRWDPDAYSSGPLGTTYATFIVETDGKITHIETTPMILPELDAEVRRLLRSMPNWIPAKFNGNPIRSRCRIPIRFEIR